MTGSGDLSTAPGATDPDAPTGTRGATDPGTATGTRGATDPDAPTGTRGAGGRGAAPVDVPDHLRVAAARWFSAGGYGERWLAELPGLVRDLAARWHLDLGPVYRGGSHSYVVSARRRGRTAVLKVPLRDRENRGEPHALRAYAGDGAVRLYEYDEPTGAMLLERAGDSALAEHPDGAVAVTLVLCDLLRRLRRPEPDGAALPRVTGLARDWAYLLRDGAPGLPPSTVPVLAAVADLAERWAAAPDGAELLVNRDAHAENVLAAEREPWLLIDPKPAVGEAAFEGGHPLLNTLGVPAGTPAGSAGPPAGTGAPPAATGVRVGGGDGRTAGDAVSADPAVPVLTVVRRGDRLEGGPGTARRVVELAALLGRGLGADPQRIRGWALIRAAENAVWALRAGLDPTGDLAQLAAVHAAGGIPG